MTKSSFITGDSGSGMRHAARSGVFRKSSRRYNLSNGRHIPTQRAPCVGGFDYKPSGGAFSAFGDEARVRALPPPKG